MLHHRATARSLAARRAVALFATTSVVALGFAGVAAHADQVKLDGDDANTSNSKNTHFTLCQGEGSSVDVIGTINYTGNANVRHFANGGVVTVTTAVPDNAAAFLHAEGGSVTTANWDDTHDTASTPAMPLTVDSNWVAGGPYKITYTFSGTDQGGVAYTDVATNNVIIEAKDTGCGGGGGGTTNTAPTVDVTGFTDGDSFPKGSEPTVGCSVDDAEDTDEAATPVVDRSGLDLDGLGTVTVTCSYTDHGGSSGSDQASYTIYDASAPVIWYTLTPPSPDGSHDWYQTDVTLTWTVSEPESPNSLGKTGCVDQNITEDQASTSYSCSATSSGGSAGPVSVSIKRDGTAASVAYTSAASSPTSVFTDPVGVTTDGLGLNGWYVVPVTATFTGTDNLSGFDASGTLTSTQTATSSGENAGPLGSVQVGSPAFTDWAGNPTAAGAASQSFNIDLTNPAVSITGPTDGATFDVCHIPSKPTFAATDGASGVDATGTGDSWTGPGGTGVGTWTYSAHATDNAGRTSTETRTYSANYGAAFGGVLQPVNADGSSRFKLGSTLPVKFKLMCGTMPISGAVASLYVRKFDSTPNPGTDEAVSTASSTTGNLFRYDPTAGQYIFNLNTKSSYTNRNGTTIAFAPGTYTLTIQLDDGTSRSIDFNLVK